MNILTEIKPEENHYIGIISFPRKLNDSVELLLTEKHSDMSWKIYPSDYKGYVSASFVFNNISEASEWTHTFSDVICDL